MVSGDTGWITEDLPFKKRIAKIILKFKLVQTNVLNIQYISLH